MIIVISLIILFLFLWVILKPPSPQYASNKKVANSAVDTSIVWEPPDTNDIPATPEGILIRYGRDLILHTGKYFGPKGKISVKANGLNCQNCHLYGGTKLYGNNFFLVTTTYPKFRNRSGSIETISDRINGCMKRSMNGDPLDTLSKEVKALTAYFHWIGKGIPEEKKLHGRGAGNLPYLERAADTLKGQAVFNLKCARCHGKDGLGVLTDDGTEYIFPPLWGPRSYNVGAGMYRISHLANFVKNNMPFGATHNYPLLSDEEAWDVAAYINSQPHPFLDCSNDWPVLSNKPIDYPFGPYADKWTEQRHKYGPFVNAKKQLSAKGNDN